MLSGLVVEGKPSVFLVLGFSGIAAGAAEIAKILFFIFLIVFVVTLIMGLRRR
jgi:uncharacterized membrane protein YtjA (UPF0391 family)